MNITEILDELPVSNVDTVIGTKGGFSFSELLTKVIGGELDLSPAGILNSGTRMIFTELFENGSLIKSLIIIALLSALLKSLTDSFKNKSVGELGFYVCYVIIAGVLFSSFYIAVGIVGDVNNFCYSFIEALLPMLTGLWIMSGNVSAAALLNSVMLFMFSFFITFIKVVIIPAVIMTCIICVLNNLSDKPMLGNAVELSKKIISFAIKGVTGLFLGILGLQSISAPLVNSALVGTVKSSTKLIPVVGSMVSGAVETALVWGKAARSGVFVAAIVMLIIVCIVPIIKLVAISLTYKLVAAVIQPVCDPRLVKCIDAVGSFTVTLMGCCIAVLILFVFSVMIFTLM